MSRAYYLGIPRISVSHKPLVVRRRDILGHVKRLVKEFEIRHVVTYVDPAGPHVLVMPVTRRRVLQPPAKRGRQREDYSGVLSGVLVAFIIPNALFRALDDRDEIANSR